MSTDTRGPDTTADVDLPPSPVAVDRDAVLVASLGVTADVIDIGRRIVAAGHTADPDCRCYTVEASHKHPPHDPVPPPPPPPPARPPRGAALSLVPSLAVDHSGVVRRLNGVAVDLIDDWATAGTDDDVQAITRCVAQIATALLAGDMESARSFLAVADEIAAGGRATGTCPLCGDEMWADELGSHITETHG